MLLYDVLRSRVEQMAAHVREIKRDYQEKRQECTSLKERLRKLQDADVLVEQRNKLEKAQFWGAVAERQQVGVCVWGKHSVSCIAHCVLLTLL